MAPQIGMWELASSRASQKGRKDGTFIDLEYVLSGPLSDRDARANVELAAPPTYDELLRQTIKLDPIAPGLWKATVHYGPKDDQDSIEPPELNDVEFTLNLTAGNNLRVTVSKRTEKYPPDEAPNREGSINVDKDGHPQGVDVPQGSTTYSETHYLPAARITKQFVADVDSVKFHTNDAPFRIWEKGEVLFTGASFGTTKKSMATATFEFEISKNANDLNIGPISGVKKGGHEYLEVTFEDEEVDEGGTKYLIARPKFVYVHKLFDEEDFAKLGIGTT